MQSKHNNGNTLGVVGTTRVHFLTFLTSPSNRGNYDSHFDLVVAVCWDTWWQHSSHSFVDVAELCHCDQLGQHYQSRAPLGMQNTVSENRRLKFVADLFLREHPNLAFCIHCKWPAKLLSTTFGVPVMCIFDGLMKMGLTQNLMTM